MTPLQALLYACILVKAQCPYDRWANREKPSPDGLQLEFLAPGQAGDCDSLAYTLGRHLIQQGVPPERIWLWVYDEEALGWHAILQVKLPDGKLWLADPTSGSVYERNGALRHGRDLTWKQVEERREINQGKPNV